MVIVSTLFLLKWILILFLHPLPFLSCLLFKEMNELNVLPFQGLFPRAKVLLTLGGTFFLAFWPLILITIASFAALYLVSSSLDL